MILNHLNPECLEPFIYYFSQKVVPEVDENGEELRVNDFDRHKIMSGISHRFRRMLRSFLHDTQLLIADHRHDKHFVLLRTKHYYLFETSIHKFIDFYLHVQFYIEFVYICEESYLKMAIIHPNVTCAGNYNEEQLGGADILCSLVDVRRIIGLSSTLSNLNMPLAAKECYVNYRKYCPKHFRDYYCPFFSCEVLYCHLTAHRVDFFRKLPHSRGLKKSVKKLYLIVYIDSKRGFTVIDDMKAILMDYYPNLTRFEIKCFWKTKSEPYVLEFCEALMGLYEAGLEVCLDFMWWKFKDHRIHKFLKLFGSVFNPQMTIDDVQVSNYYGTYEYHYRADGLIVNLECTYEHPTEGSVWYSEPYRLACRCISYT
ncbi:unnamed protein product [Bursaphelenchus okinawaensis]|uniref:Uncharacterized protein n=1 Tax=Bursaphelenchus okinawaensis TaxID=465554 RepID=A0A811KAP0_9BILA|nr:unnamed protein product [Bursaphelenchus okinawaensis]CAG9095889.1 unnamed protein product [Bursaphelenchus okinawaensis]